jgi:hypothetical protein
MTESEANNLPSQNVFEFGGRRRLVLSVILIFCALTFLNPIRLFLTPWLECLGLYQTWNLFSPDVRGTNFYVSALVEYEDGELKMVEFPRMNLLSFSERFQKQKMRKLFVDSWASPEMKPFREGEAKYVARMSASGVAKPKSIRLTLNWSAIPGPDHFIKRESVPPEYNRDTYFIYQVKAEDLL